MRTAYKLGVLIMTGIAGMAAIAWVAHDGGAVRSWLLILTTATAVSGWGMLWIIKPHLLEQDDADLSDAELDAILKQCIEKENAQYDDEWKERVHKRLLVGLKKKLTEES